MSLETPLWMQPATGDPEIKYSALADRDLLAALFGAAGVISPGDLKVTQRAEGANFSVDISPGRAVIQGDDVSEQGVYLVRSTATENRTVPSPPASGTRVHRVVAQVRDKLHNAGVTVYDFALEVLEDTGTGTPATPASAISRATVSVSAGQASVTDANITSTIAVAALRAPVPSPHGNVHHEPDFATQTDLDTHSGASNPHPGSASDTELNNHTGASNPHTGSASTTDLNNHASDTTNIHGISSTASLLTDSDDSGNVLGGSASGGAGDIAVGDTSTASGSNSIAIGRNAAATNNPGIAIGSSAVSDGNSSVAIGAGATVAPTHFSAVALGNSAATTGPNQITLGEPAGNHDVEIPGSLNVTGTKNFVVPHPNDPKRTVRHGAYEGPVPGGTIYRYRVTTAGGTATVDLPDYFAALTADVDVHISPVGHFGRAYGDVAGQTLTVTAETDGEYAVLILGTRNDDRARQAWATYRETKPADRMWNGKRPDEVPT